MREHLDGRCMSEDPAGGLQGKDGPPAASILAPTDLYFDCTQHKFCVLEQIIVLSEIQQNQESRLEGLGVGCKGTL